MSDKITAYPWKVQLIEHRLYIKSVKHGLPMVGQEGSIRAIDRSTEEHINNARVMAAAPELLEAILYYRDKCSGAEPSISVFQQMIDEVIEKHNLEGILNNE